MLTFAPGEPHDEGDGSSIQLTTVVVIAAVVAAIPVAGKERHDARDGLQDKSVMR